MMVVLVNVGLAGLFGFFLAIYFCFYRLNLSNPWRFVTGILSGLVVGIFMALIDFWIIWPPANTLFTVIGFGIIALIAAIALIGKPAQRQPTKI